MLYLPDIYVIHGRHLCRIPVVGYAILGEIISTNSFVSITAPYHISAFFIPLLYKNYKNAGNYINVDLLGGTTLFFVQFRLQNFERFFFILNRALHKCDTRHKCRTLCWDRSSWFATTIPEGIWVILTALSVVFTLCPPQPYIKHATNQPKI